MRKIDSTVRYATKDRRTWVLVFWGMAIALALGAGVMTFGPSVVAAAMLILAVTILTCVSFRFAIAATLILAFGALPAVIPPSFDIGPVTVAIFEPFLVASAIHALFSPTRTYSNRARVGLPWIFWLFALAVAVGALVGLARGFAPAAIITDTRSLVCFFLAAIIGLRLPNMVSLSFAKGLLRAVLIGSAIMVIAGSMGLVELGGRTESAQLWSVTGAQIGSSAGAERLLSDTVFLALATLCALFPAMIFGAASRDDFWGLAAPAMIVIFFSYSRNPLIALVAAAGFTALAAVTRGSATKLLTSTARFGFAVITGVLAVWFLLHTIGLMDGIYSAIQAYGDRVFAGLNPSVQQVDSSTQDRVLENAYMVSGVLMYPGIGSGYGFAYRPGFGESESFTAVLGRLYGHNYYLWTLMKGGVFGLAALVMLIVLIIVPPLSPRAPVSRVIIGAAAIGLASVMFVAPLLNSGHNGLLVGLVMGLAGSTLWNQKSSGVGRTSARAAELKRRVYAA